MKITHNRWCCIPLSYAFYRQAKDIDSDFKTKYEQATKIITAISKVFIDGSILIIADSWYGNKGLLFPLRRKIGNRVHLLSRLRCDATIYGLPGKKTAKVGRKLKYGGKMGNPKSLAKQFKSKAQTYQANLRVNFSV